MKPFFNIFGYQVPTFGMLMVAAALVAWAIISILSKKSNYIKRSDGFYAYLFGICGAFVGAAALRPITKIFEILIFSDRYDISSFQDLMGILFGEIVFYGGFLGGLVAILIYCRKFKVDTFRLFDIFAPAVAAGHAIGRIGCLLGGCCYGIEVSNSHPFAIIYPSVSQGAPAGVALLAVPLMEAVFLLVLAVVLVFLVLKLKKVGYVTTLYLLAYSAWRFIIEFFRGDVARGGVGFLSTSQIISVFIFISGIVYFLRIKRFHLANKEK